MIRLSPFHAALFVTFLPSIAIGELIWIEGEAAPSRKVAVHGWYDSVKKDVLSGKDWLSHYGDAPGEAEFEISANDGGEYTFWVRMNPVGSKPRWRIDDGDWAAVPLEDARGQQNIASDNKPDHRFIAWLKLGSVKLAKGEHTIGFRWEGGAANSGGLDCFVLTNDSFVPQGTMKPTAEHAGTADAWFPLLADEDPFSPESVIDMSSLVPAPAGQFGALKAAGKDLRFENGSVPVKFWGVGANVQPGRYSREQLTRRARYLRKFGVTIVRQHAVFDELSANGKIDPKKLDEYDWWFAELKKHGIYSDWSVFYHFTIGPDAGYPEELYAELDGKDGRKDTYGIITVSPELWAIRNRTLVALLDHKNPYTGLRYADDPALAVVEMQNEDSVFFWNPLGWVSEGKKMPLHSKRLRERWAAWVAARYKTDATLKEAWGELKGGDTVKAAELALMGPWELPGEGPRGRFDGQTKRAGDYIRFLAEMQRADFAECEKAIRGTGFKAVTVTTGWQVGGAASEAANIWTDTVGGMIDRHNYFGGGEGGHGITEGKVNNSSHLGTPGSGLFSMGMRQVEDKPFSVTEWTQSAPNQWKLEAAPIMAFYGLGLQGWDASFHFIQSGTRLGDGWPGMSSYATDTPHFIGQFPALAFALHHGHIREASVVAARRLEVDAVFSGTDALKQDFTQGSYDAKTIANAGGTPTEAFAVGRVTVAFGTGESKSVDLAPYWDEAGKVVRSETGELTWDYGREVIRIESERTQGIVGKTGEGTFELPGVTVAFETPFVSTLFTPLDNLPLAESKHILITALARDAQSGTRYNADGTRLEAVGTAPLLLEPVRAKIRFKGDPPKAVRALDHHGVPNGKSVPVPVDGNFAVDGTYQCHYYEVIR